MRIIAYYLIFALTWLFSVLPFKVLYLIADLLYVVIYCIAGYRKKTVLSNLGLAFPDHSEKEIQSVAKKFYRHFADFLVEYIKGISMPLKVHRERFNFLNPEIFRDFAEQGKNVALVSAHYNNWEWSGILTKIMPHEVLVIYRPLKNKVIDRLTKYIRSRHKTKLVPMEHVYRNALNNSRTGKLFMVWFLADQRPPRDNTFWTTFLNQEASFYQGAEKMARKLDMAVVFYDIQKRKRGFYDVTFKKLFDNGAETKENEITLACINEMEKEIMASPEFWLWSHKRFKHKRPDGIELIKR